ncbi:MAG: response regulator transcription factor [Gammaproteobacteria bacterium]|nr:response regulator transcription factor [Gammaproteobacteria bacterium]MCB1860531.1 response regulator transcription factor [Gammaproteobacteria bacterium]MCB1904953.1 response regulator transcription factor [Gammaproteobacteria bacterium]
MTRLLLVEDDALLGDGIRKILVQRGDEVEWARDGESALASMAQGGQELILLDLNLPGISGLDILQRLRSAGNDIPILVLTARGEVADRVRALDCGADDYLIKPFDIDELSARIRALRRRASGVTDDRLCHGELIMDISAHVVQLAEQPVALSVREFGLLQILLENRGRVLSRKQLEERLYGWEDEIASNSIEVHVHNLRKKLAGDLIRTVRGVGYVIEKAE